MSTLIIPGDNITVSDNAEVVIGPGLQSNSLSKEIIPINAGILQSSTYNNKQTLHIESNSRRYIPATGDFVIGTVTGTFGESYRVSLSNFSSNVSLNSMAFPNATKKNRPNLKVGSLIYARISHADPEIDVEIECLDPTTGKDGGFGVLENGYVFEVSLAFARTLLFDQNFPLLNLLVKRCKFEIAIGLNGKIWVKTDDLRHSLAVSKSIENSQFVKKDQFNKIIATTFKELEL